VVSSLRAFKEATAVEMPKLFGTGPNFEALGYAGTWLDLDRCAAVNNTLL
jgi:hypothetical protein